MRWILFGELDVSTANGWVYVIDGNNMPHVNRMQGAGTGALGAPAEDAADARSTAADICAKHAGMPKGDHVFEDAW